MPEILGVAEAGGLHGQLGYALLSLMGLQILLGTFRGSKGGPTAPAKDGSLRGDHYDMTLWRVMFEWSHKLIGYVALGLAVVVILAGLWEANAPRWMWSVVVIWWVGLIVAAAIFQVRGCAIDTYQAIWGPDPKHPGNHREPIGLGICRAKEGEPHVRND